MIKYVIFILIFLEGLYAQVWTIENVDITDTTGGIVVWESPLNLCLDSHGNPHIAYVRIEDASSLITLRYGYKDSSGWHLEILDTLGSVWAYPSLALDKNDFPHLIYSKPYGNYHYYLNYMYKDSSGWHKEEKIDTVINPSGSGVIIWISMGLDTLGNPHVVFNGGSGEPSAWYAYRENDLWHFDSLFHSYATCGSIRLNKKQLPRFSNFWFGDQLYYSHKEDTLWIHEPVDTIDPYASWWPTALALDSQDRPYIAYKDPYPFDYRLKCAFFDGGFWNIEVVDSHDCYIYSPRAIAIDTIDRPYIVYNRIDPVRTLDYIYWTGTEWRHIFADIPRGDTSRIYGGPLVIDKNGISHWLARAQIRVGSNYKHVLRYGYGDPTQVEEKISILPFNSFSIYPNPFSDKIFLKLPFYLRNSLLDVELYDVSGRVFLSNKFKGKRVLSLKVKVPGGIYFLKVKKNGKILYRQKIIKLK